MKKVIFICLAVALAATTVFIGCKKVETLNSTMKINDKFFNLSTTIRPELKKVANELKRQNQLKEFIQKFAKAEGIPVWEKSIINKKVKLTNSFVADSNAVDSTTFALIPLVLQNTNYVNSFILAKVENDVIIQVYNGNDYAKYGFEDASSSEAISAEKLALIEMNLDKEVFGDSYFAINDSRLFNPNLDQLPIRNFRIFGMINEGENGLKFNWQEQEKLNIPIWDDVKESYQWLNYKDKFISNFDFQLMMENQTDLVDGNYVEYINSEMAQGWEKQINVLNDVISPAMQEIIVSKFSGFDYSTLNTRTDGINNFTGINLISNNPDNSSKRLVIISDINKKEASNSKFYICAVETPEANINELKNNLENKNIQNGSIKVVSLSDNTVILKNVVNGNLIESNIEYMPLPAQSKLAPFGPCFKSCCATAMHNMSWTEAAACIIVAEECAAAFLLGCSAKCLSGH